jgi:hypothetical protein
MSSLSKLEHNVETYVSGYDRLNAILISVILLFGFLVTVLFMIWLTSVFDYSDKAAVAMTTTIGDDGDEKPEGFEDDIFEPGVEDFPEVETPQLANALEAVTDAVSSVKASLEKRSGDSAQMGRGGGYGSREGGTGGSGKGIPDYKRWVINYECDSIDVYARQLDQFEIELGVVSTNTNKIWRVQTLSTGPKSLETDRSRENKTLRFAHIKPRMKKWDESLAKRAGVPLGNTAMVQFYPNGTRQYIRQQEANYLAEAGRELQDVKKTMFQVVKEGDEFIFKVTECLYAR